MRSNLPANADARPARRQRRGARRRRRRGPHRDAPRRIEGGGSRPRTVRARKCRKGEFRRPPTPEDKRRGTFASLGKAPLPGSAPRSTRDEQH
jgi:hypothetical protein